MRTRMYGGVKGVGPGALSCSIVQLLTINITYVNNNIYYNVLIRRSLPCHSTM